LTVSRGRAGINESPTTMALPLHLSHGGPMTQDQIKARLTLDVTYDLHRSAAGLSADYIRDTLEALVKQGIITADEAISHASDSQSLYHKLS